MKRKRILLSVVAFMLGISLTACGEPVKELTAEEESIITLYAAKVVAKHNVRLAQGLVRYKAKDEEESEDASEEEKPKEETSEPEGEGTEAADAANPPEEGGEEAATEATQSTLNEALGIQDINFTFKSAEFADDYVYSNYYHLTPKAGNNYLIMHFTAENTSDAAKDVDIYSMAPAFSATVGDKTYESEATILPNDLSTFVGKIEAKKSNDLVLLFEVPSDIEQDVNKIGLSLNVNSKDYNITL